MKIIQEKTKDKREKALWVMERTMNTLSKGRLNKLCWLMIRSPKFSKFWPHFSFITLRPPSDCLFKLAEIALIALFKYMCTFNCDPSINESDYSGWCGCEGMSVLSLISQLARRGWTFWPRPAWVEIRRLQCHWYTHKRRAFVPFFELLHPWGAARLSQASFFIFSLYYRSFG